MAAVFVAGKVEECIRRARDIVNVFHHLYCLIRGLPAHSIDYVGDTYYVWRDRLCTAEALLLRSLGFHVQPASPVPLLISYLKVMELPQLIPELPQAAFCWLNDLLRTPAGVLFQPNVLAVTAIDLAASQLNFSFPTDLIAEWYALFDANEEELKECKIVVLEALQGAGEMDFLLPLTKEELKIFASQIESEAEEEEQDLEHVNRNNERRNSRDYEVSISSSRDYDVSINHRSNYSRESVMSHSRSHSRESSRISHHYTSHSRDYRSRSRSRSKPAAAPYYYNKQHRN